MSYKPIVSIELPVYNGEKFLRKRLESILSQTLQDFEIIISDNRSSDKTLEISKEFLKKDNRIKYFRQEKNIGALRNWLFVLREASHEYFIWASVDDKWEPTFLENNVKFLDSNKEFVGSIGRVDYYGEKIPKRKPKRFLKRMQVEFYDDYPGPGCSYEKLVKFFLRLRKGELIYAVFRTSKIKKVNVLKQMAAQDLAMILAVLKYGEINLGNEVLMHRYSKGISGVNKGIKRFQMFNDYGLIGKIFPFLPFSYWSIKNLGIKIFLKNFDYFLWLNYAGMAAVLRSLLKKV